MWYNNFLYEVPHELPNDSRIRKLRNIWITQNWVGTQLVRRLTSRNVFLATTIEKAHIKVFFFCLGLLGFLQILLPDLNVKAVWAVQRNCVININMVVPFQEVCKKFYDEGSL